MTCVSFAPRSFGASWTDHGPVFSQQWATIQPCVTVIALPPISGFKNHVYGFRWGLSICVNFARGRQNDVNVDIMPLSTGGNLWVYISHDASLHITPAHINLGQSLGNVLSKWQLGTCSSPDMQVEHTTAASDNYVDVYAQGSDSVVGPVGTSRAPIDLAQWSCTNFQGSFWYWTGRHDMASMWG